MNYRKQQKIIQTALDYIQTKEIVGKNFRFDVISILKDKINHIENAFEVIN